MGVYRGKALISTPLPQGWELLIRPRAHASVGPLPRPVTGADRPFQVSDRVTQSVTA